VARGNAMGRKYALLAIGALAAGGAANHRAIAAAGGIDALLEAARGPHRFLAEKARRALAMLAAAPNSGAGLRAASAGAALDAPLTAQRGA
jgi:hypothetical protein